MLNINTNIPTSVADRIRNATDAEMASIITEYAVGLAESLLKEVGYEIKQDMPGYTAITLAQLQKPTEERPRAYTLEEMKEMRGQMVYVHYIGPCHGFYPDDYMPFFGDDEIGIKLINEQYSRLHMPLNLYNKSWVALAYKPNETLCVLD